MEIGGPGNSFDYDLERLLNYVRAQTKEECKHYDREEINLVEDGNTPPVVRCKQCGKILKELGF
ncbi:MAG: hypothetical protein KIS29_09920 [Thermoplasmata archaeon]|nr:hypothetical protein [Candidatus Sysuiplasma jiujiangense]